MIKLSSFRFRLTLSYILVIVFSFGFIGYFLDKNLEENSLKEIRSSLKKQALLVERSIPAEAIHKEDMSLLQKLAFNVSTTIGSRVTIIDAQGVVLADSEKPLGEIANMENHARRPEVAAALSGDTGESIRYSSTLKIDMLYLAVPIAQKSAVFGVLRLALPLENIKHILFTIRKSILISLLFALGLAFMLGSLLSRAIVKPLNRIMHVVRKYAQGDFGHRIYISSQDEIGELAATLNKMSLGLEEKIREVQLQNQQLVAVLESMVEGIIVVDSQSRVVSMNHAAQRIFNIELEQAKGKILLEVLRNNDLAEIVQQALGGTALVSKELTLVWPVQKIFQVNACALYEKNKISGCLAVIHDMTEIRRLETMRRDFVANVSHELKTPLTSIKGFIETLLEGALEDKDNNRHFLEIVREHANRLEALVNDLLDLSKLESRTQEFKQERVVLNELAGEILRGFQSQLAKKEIVEKNELDETLVVNADRQKIERVFINLIDNAIKFNRQKGNIRIYGQSLDAVVKVYIEDTGQGISEKDLSRIFERFYRVDKARSRELGGTGLGLSIVKHIVELHGGSVGVESTEGAGSRFWFTLPT